MGWPPSSPTICLLSLIRTLHFSPMISRSQVQGTYLFAVAVHTLPSSSLSFCVCQVGCGGAAVRLGVAQQRQVPSPDLPLPGEETFPGQDLGLGHCVSSPQPCRSCPCICEMGGSGASWALIEACPLPRGMWAGACMQFQGHVDPSVWVYLVLKVRHQPSHQAQKGMWKPAPPHPPCPRTSCPPNTANSVPPEPSHLGRLFPLPSCVPPVGTFSPSTAPSPLPQFLPGPTLDVAFGTPCLRVALRAGRGLHTCSGPKWCQRP